MPQSKAASGNAGQDNTGCQVVLAIGFVVLLIYGLGQCASKPTATIDAEKPFGVASLSDQVEAIEPTAKVEPLAPLQVKRGLRHLRIVIAAEGLSGAMIYSQSCYDGVSQSLSWAALDRCGGFDLQASKLAQQSTETDVTSELEYFGPETAAARYLAIATKGGESAESADLRLEEIQKQVSRAEIPTAVTVTEGESAEAGLEEGVDEDAGSATPTRQPSSQMIDQNWLDRVTGNVSGER